MCRGLRCGAILELYNVHVMKVSDPDWSVSTPQDKLFFCSILMCVCVIVPIHAVYVVLYPSVCFWILLLLSKQCAGGSVLMFGFPIPGELYMHSSIFLFM